MDDHKNLPVVGEEPDDNQWEEIKAGVEVLLGGGMTVKKVLNYKGGSIKYIATINPGKPHNEVRVGLEEKGWQLGSPYFSRGKIDGFKVSKVMHGTDVNAWGG